MRLGTRIFSYALVLCCLFPVKALGSSLSLVHKHKRDAFDFGSFLSRSSFVSLQRKPLSEKKILLLYARVGGGNKSTVDAVEAWIHLLLEEWGESPPQIDAVDLFSFAQLEEAQRKGIDEWLQKYKTDPEGFLSDGTDRYREHDKEVHLTLRFHSASLKDFAYFKMWFADFGSEENVKKWMSYDLIICAQAQAQTALNLAFEDEERRAKVDLVRRSFPPFWMINTDVYANIHLVKAYTTRYFIVADDSIENFKNEGVPPQRLTKSAIPIKPAFANCASLEVNEADLLADSCIGQPPPPGEESNSRITVMVLLGADGVGVVEATKSILEAARAHPAKSVRILPMTARNKEAFEELKGPEMASMISQTPNVQMCPQGFTSRMSEFMKISTFMVSKPGGLSTPESIACGLFFVAMPPAGPQEVYNLQFLWKKNAVVLASGPSEIQSKVSNLLGNPDKIRDLKARVEELRSSDLNAEGGKLVAGEALTFLRKKSKEDALTEKDAPCDKSTSVQPEWGGTCDQQFGGTAFDMGLGYCVCNARYCSVPEMAPFDRPGCVDALKLKAFQANSTEDVKQTTSTTPAFTPWGMAGGAAPRENRVVPIESPERLNSGPFKPPPRLGWRANKELCKESLQRLIEYKMSFSVPETLRPKLPLHCRPGEGLDVVARSPEQVRGVWWHLDFSSVWSDCGTSVHVLSFQEEQLACRRASLRKDFLEAAEWVEVKGGPDAVKGPIEEDYRILGAFAFDVLREKEATDIFKGALPCIGCPGVQMFDGKIFLLRAR